MKKKKLKNKIKKLERQVVDIANAQNGIIHNLRDRISTLDDTITKNDQSYKSEFGTIKHSAREIRNKVDVLERRTTTDYSSFGNNYVPEACANCVHNEEATLGLCGLCYDPLKMKYTNFKPKEEPKSCDTEPNATKPE